MEPGLPASPTHPHPCLRLEEQDAPGTLHDAQGPSLACRSSMRTNSTFLTCLRAYGDKPPAQTRALQRGGF